MNVQSEFDENKKSFCEQWKNIGESLEGLGEKMKERKGNEGRLADKIVLPLDVKVLSYIF